MIVSTGVEIARQCGGATTVANGVWDRRARRIRGEECWRFGTEVGYGSQGWVAADGGHSPRGCRLFPRCRTRRDSTHPARQGVSASCEPPTRAQHRLRAASTWQGTRTADRTRDGSAERELFRCRWSRRLQQSMPTASGSPWRRVEGLLSWIESAVLQAFGTRGISDAAGWVLRHPGHEAHILSRLDEFGD